MIILYACTDDGSSSCCCWASWERAAVFLGLYDEELRGEAYAETCKKSRKTRKKQACSSLRSIMKRHGTVTVRNHASTFDSTCQDLVFSSQSEKIISSLDRDFFQSLILKACCNTLVVSFICTKQSHILWHLILLYGIILVWIYAYRY